MNTGLPNAEALYDEPQVIGNLPADAMQTVAKSAAMADHITTSALGKYHMDGNTKAPIVMDRMEPENGLVNGYTDGHNIGVNEYIVPETSAFYRLTKGLSESKNPLARYIYNKLSRPIDNLIETIVHEKLHITTQMKERYDGNGKKTNFINDLYLATNEYLREKLPNRLKPMSNYIANKVLIPMIEGLNTGMTHEAMGLKYTGQIKDAASREPTTYGQYTTMAANSLEQMGFNSPGQFYKSYFERGYNVAKGYVAKFMDSLGGCFNRQQPCAAYACVNA